MIDQASVFAERYKGRPQILQATVLGQGGDPHLDPYTALRALQLIKESNQMAMARQAQQPTSAPSLLSDAMTPPQPPAMPMGAPVAQGQPPQRPMPQGMPQGPAPQAPVMQASGGLAGMHVPEEHYAGGGILAFSGEDDSLVDSNVEPRSADASGTSRLAEQYRLYGEGKVDDEDTGGDGSPADQAAWNRYALQRLKAIQGYNPKEMSAADQDAFLSKYIARAKKEAGPDIYAPAESDLTSREEARKANMGQMSGLALLAAAGNVLKGRNLAEGASNAAPAYASAMGEAMRADQAEKRSMEQMKFALADARRKENQGYHRDANAALEGARKFQADANKAAFDKERALAEIGVRGAAANRPRSGAGQAPNNVQLVDNLAAEYISKGMPPVAAKAKATRELLAAQGTKAITSNVTSTSNLPETDPRAVQGAAKLNAMQNDKLLAHMTTWDDSTEAKKAKRMGNYDAVRKAEQDRVYADLLRGVVSEAPPAVNLRGTTSAPRRSPPAGFVPD